MVVSTDSAPGCPGESWSEFLDLGSLPPLTVLRGPQREHVSMKRVLLMRRLLGSRGGCRRSHLRRRLGRLILARFVFGFSVILVVTFPFPLFFLLGQFCLPFLFLLPFSLHLSYLFGTQSRFWRWIICNAGGEPRILKVGFTGIEEIDRLSCG